MVPEWIQRHCVVPDGFRQGEPFTLYDYQLEYFGNFYLVRGDAEWVPDNPVLAPAFVFRRGLLVGPQKLGKGPHTAAHVCLEGAGPALFAGWAGGDDGYACAANGCGCGWEYPYDKGEPMGMRWPTPLVQITAFSIEQTENIYDALRPMIEKGPLADIIPKTGEDFIRLPGGGRIDTVTSSAQSRLGQRVTFVPQDEVGIWTATNKMLKVADTQYRGLAGMGGRASLTTNAWDPSENSVAQLQFTSPSKDIYRQFQRPPKRLKYTDPADRAEIHQAVYPSDVLRENGGHVDLVAIEGEASDILVRDPQQAARFFGNILAAGAGHAVEPDTWDSLSDFERTVATIPRGTRIGLGFDGSISDDSTVLRGCLPDGHRFTIGSWVRPEGPAAVDWRVPRLEVDEMVAWAFDHFDVGRMLCDPPHWTTEIEIWMARYNPAGAKAENAVVVFFDTNQDRKMGLAVDRWLTSIGEGRKAGTHDGDEVVSQHVKNAFKRKARAKDPEDDKRTLYTLTKGDDYSLKIDGAVADVLALEAAMTMPASTPPPVPASGSAPEHAVPSPDLFRPTGRLKI